MAPDPSPAPAATDPADADQPPPVFSDAELSRRRGLIGELAARHDLDAVVVYGANRSGGAIPWLTRWPVTREAVAVLRPGRDPVLLVGYANHVPNAARVATDCEVLPCGESTAETLGSVLGASARTGLIGNPPAPVRSALATGGGPVALDRDYTRLRQVKSAEELACLRYAAMLTDRSAAALVAAAVPGATELDLVAAVEASYAGTGATNHIHYVCSTSMQEPDRCVPGQLPTHRRLRSGAAVVFELSTAWGPEYAGQLLRTVLVDVDEPTPLYRDLHELAAQVHDAIVAALAPGATPADLVALAQPVLDAGLVTVDDLLHGFGGGYLPPVLSQRAAPTGMHAEPLAAGMTVVVQPNVATPDLRAGVQTGELYEITPTGARSLHDFPPGLVRAG